MKPTSLLALMAGFILSQAVSAANSDSTPNSFGPHGKNLSLPESAPEREARHRKIAERRSGPIVIVHRGASALAPENTLEAYAAAMDHGADGCEMDIRRTVDGMLVMLHDDGLDRMTEALGRINQYTYRELAGVSFRPIYGPNPETRIPKLAAVLELARHRAMLLHLDIKEPGLEQDIARLLDAADAWDQVVAVNEYNAAELRKNPKLKLLTYKVSGLDEGRLDMDPDQVKGALAKPGNMIMVDDPRVAARQLKRKPQPVPLPEHVNRNLPTEISSTLPDTNSFSPARYLRSLATRVDARSSHQLEALLTADFPERTAPDGDAAYQRRRTARILERAWAAQKIGQLGVKSARAIKLLEQQAAHRSLHRDWAYHGLDGVMATRALGQLRAAESVPFLAQTFFAIDPELKKLMTSPANYPYAWNDFRPKLEIVFALGEIRCDQSKTFLLDYLAMDGATASKSSPPLFEAATRALMAQDLTSDELRHVLQSTNSAVRGAAILECLDHPTASRRSCSRAVMPWIEDLVQN